MTNGTDHHNLKQYSFFALLPAFKAGLYDGMNPCGFASALLLVLYLSWVGHTQRRVFWLGLMFIASSAITHFLLATGLFDAMITDFTVTLCFQIFYFVLVAVFLILGVFNMMDRRQYEKHFDTGKFRCKVPAFLKSRPGETPESKMKEFLVAVELILSAMIAGIFVTLCASIYPQREYIFIVHSYLMAGGNAKFAFLSFFQYGIASVLPLVIAWFAVFLLGLGRTKTNVILYYKGIAAALFLSVGAGLEYFLLW